MGMVRDVRGPQSGWGTSCPFPTGLPHMGSGTEPKKEQSPLLVHLMLPLCQFCPGVAKGGHCCGHVPGFSGGFQRRWSPKHPLLALGFPQPRQQPLPLCRVSWIQESLVLPRTGTPSRNSWASTARLTVQNGSSAVHTEPCSSQAQSGAMGIQ